MCPRRPPLRAFTLLELLLVVFILAAVAGTTASLTAQADEQFRYDDTKARREEIRRAILGDPLRVVNGQPLQNGFVADTGRLPASIRELLERVQAPPPGAVLWSTEHFQAAGWRGPYLRAQQEGARSVYRDGWSNADLTASPDDFGWVLGRDAGALSLQSLGSDGLPGPAPAGALDWAVDQPLDATLLVPDDWLVTGRPVRIRNGTGADLPAGGNPLLLRVHLPAVASDGQVTWTTLDSDPVVLPAIPADAEAPIPFSFPAGQGIPIGLRSAVLIGVNTPATTLGPEAPLTVLPRTSPAGLLTLDTAPPTP